MSSSDATSTWCSPVAEPTRVRIEREVEVGGKTSRLIVEVEAEQGAGRLAERLVAGLVDILDFPPGP